MFLETALIFFIGTILFLLFSMPEYKWNLFPIMTLLVGLLLFDKASNHEAGGWNIEPDAVCIDTLKSGGYHISAYKIDTIKVIKHVNSIKSVEKIKIKAICNEVEEPLRYEVNSE